MTFDYNNIKFSSYEDMRCACSAVVQKCEVDTMHKRAKNIIFCNVKYDCAEEAEAPILTGNP